MGLAAGQVRLLMLTRRKSDIELRMNFNSMQKMALSRESANLSTEYYGKLQSKNISYYENGSYKKVSYSYLMGYGANYTAITNGTRALKSDNSMVLTDYTGKVVLSDTYRNAIMDALGTSNTSNLSLNSGISDKLIDTDSNNQLEKISDSTIISALSSQYEEGEMFTLTTNNFAKILANICNAYTEAEFKAVINGNYSSSYDATTTSSGTGEAIEDTTVDNSATKEEKIQQIIDFYLPIFQAAASNGWTTAYNDEITNNEDYVNDALVSGIFALQAADYTGNYDEGTSLEYFITAGSVEENSLSTAEREEIETWYQSMLADINTRESWLDLDLQNLNTELNAVNTDIQSVDSFIKDALKMFEWGSN